MSTFMKIMLVPALVIAFSVGVAIAASGGGDAASPLAQVAPSTGTVDSTTTDTTSTTTTEADEDVSGPCDEAEHANDPRCTGVGDDRDDRDDNSGPGRGGDDDREDDDNSGPGNAHDDDDDDDNDDDRSGHGGGDDDEDDR